MVKYIYEKYNSTYSSGTTTTYTENSWGAWSNDTKNADTAFYGHSNYGFSSSSGLYTIGAENTYYTNATYYRGGGTSLMEFQLYDSSGGVANYRYRTKTATKTTSSYGNYSRGSYVGQVFAEDGTYPSNGRHSDGYWYVKRGEATAPTLTSPNGGESWDSLETITWTNSQNGLEYKIELSLDNGQSWRTLKNSTAYDATSWSYDFKDETQTSTAKIRVTGINNGLYTLSDSSDGVFTISHNQAPNAPSIVYPKNGNVIDLTRTARFEWIHNDPNVNDPQSVADLEYRAQGTATWTRKTVNQLDQFTSFNTNTFAAGIYDWRVRTYDQRGLQSPWSSIAIFNAAEPTDAPIITKPADVETVARPVAEWVASGQTAYKITIQDSIGTEIWNTGEVVSTVRAVTIGVDLLNSGVYTLSVQVKNAGGIWSTFASKTFSISYTPPPKPTIFATVKGHYLEVGIENAEPGGTEPPLTGNDLYRRKQGELTWKRIASGLGDAYQDHAVASGQVYEYKVIAIGANGTSNESETASDSVTFTGVYIHSVQDAEGTSQHYKFDGSGRDSSKQAEHVFRQFAGRKKQAVEFGELLGYAVSASVQVLRDNDGAARLEEFVENMETICYRDGRGRLLFGVITTAPLNDVVYGWETTINVAEIDYSEVV